MIECVFRGLGKDKLQNRISVEILFDHRKIAKNYFFRLFNNYAF